MVREVATRPLTQDLLSHEVRGSGGPQPQLPSPAPCPLSPKQVQCQGLWGVWEGRCVCACSSLTLALTLCLSLRPPGLLHPGPGGPEDLRVEGKGCQCPGEKGSHEPGAGGHGVLEEESCQEWGEKQPPQGEGSELSPSLVPGRGQGRLWANGL